MVAGFFDIFEDNCFENKNIKNFILRKKKFYYKRIKILRNVSLKIYFFLLYKLFYLFFVYALRFYYFCSKIKIREVKRNLESGAVVRYSIANN